MANTSTVNQDNTAHYELLDALRGLAAQAVFIVHALAFSLPNPSDQYQEEIRGWIGRIAVVFFFALSGYVIAGSIKNLVNRYEKRFDWIDFGVRRAARIYPPYLGALAIALFLTLMASMGLPLVGAGSLLLNFEYGTSSWIRALVFLFRNGDAFQTLNGPIWSLRIEVGLYLFSALLTLAILRRGTARVLLFGMLIGASGFCVLRLFFAFPAIVVFGTAAALAFLPANSRLLRWPQIWIGLTALTCLLPAVIPTLMIDINDSYSSLSYQTLAGMLFASAVASMSKMRTVVDSAFSRLIIMSGGWSYSLYIMHYPLLIGLYSCAVYFSPKSILVQSGVIFFPLFFTINILCFAAARLLERPKYFARQLKHVLKMQAVAHHL